MRCRTCDYRLWNIRSRKCPECGTTFLPSEHEFVPNSVRFCCPHCDAAYYGTAEDGHLVPVEFDCVSCHTHIHMDDMVLLPADGLEEEQTTVEQMPWLNRGEIGRIKAWFTTVGMALAHPARLIHLVPVQSSTRTAIGFAVLSNTLVSLAGMGLFMAFPFLIGSSRGGGAGIGASRLVAALSIMVLGTVAASLASILLWGVIAHGLLRLTGPTSAGIGRTFHAMGYSAGANAVTAVPFCGVYVGWIGWVVSAIIMLKDAQKVGGGRAAFAVLPLPLLGVGGSVALWALAMYSIFSGAGGPFGTSATGNSTAYLVSALQHYADANGGRLPEHAIELVSHGLVIGDDFVIHGSLARQKKTLIGGISLDKFAYPPSAQQARHIKAGIKALPPHMVAHRLGDFVFTYHGIDLRAADPGLWLVAEIPEQVSQRGPTFTIGCADGRAVQFPTSFLPRVPKRQNALRAKYGLPPLPALSTVAHDAPAVGAVNDEE